jgi:hypothetical protein
VKIICEWMVLAERVLDDSTTGNLTIVSCLERVQSLAFPAHHHGFAVAARFRCLGQAPESNCTVGMRLVRACESDPEEVISEAASEWQAGVDTARWVMNFHFLRLKRPETLQFRLEYRVGDGIWEHGATSYLDIKMMELTEEQRRALTEEFRARGFQMEGLVS